MKLLIAYDGSAFADAAIDDLTKAGLPAAAEAVVMSITDAWELPEIVSRVAQQGGRISKENSEVIQNHLQQVITNTEVLAESASARIRSLFPGWKVTSEARTGKPAWEIIKYSDDWRPDLIVMGSHGRGFVGRAVLGSVSMKVLHEATCSVRIAREGKSGEGPNRILVAVDGSENADFCVETVTSRNWDEDAEFRIITADDDPASRPEISALDAVPEGFEDSEEAIQWMERVITGPGRKMKNAGLRTSQYCRWGDARRVILDEAEVWEADSIFIGARGLSRFKRLLIGSVSAAVASKAKCSVEIVRRSD
jgi:nucleotide-binding universal stress UspA family protein